MSKHCIPIVLQALLAFGICTGLSAQQLITSVEFTGLTKSKESFLRQYITTTAGQEFDSSRLVSDRQRLLNLAILGEVETQILSDNNSVKIIFKCREMINTLPVFTLGKTDDTFWFRVGLQSLSFSGRGYGAARQPGVNATLHPNAGIVPDFIHADVEGQNSQIGPPAVNYSDTG